MKEAEYQSELEEWLIGRPEVIQHLARLYPPWKIYRIKATGQLCQIYCYTEDGAVTVDTEPNFIGMVHRVFGYKEGDIEEASVDPNNFGMYWGLDKECL